MACTRRVLDVDAIGMDLPEANFNIPIERPARPFVWLAEQLAQDCEAMHIVDEMAEACPGGSDKGDDDDSVASNYLNSELFARSSHQLL